MNRAQRRAEKHQKNRLFTKKGYTRVILRDDSGTFWNIPTAVGSRKDGLAKHSVKKFHRDQKRG